MCGIVGVLAFGSMKKKDEMVRQSIMRYLSTELLLETKDRGEDATGAAILFSDGAFGGVKRGEEAGGWMARIGKTDQSYGSFIDGWRQYEKCGKDGKIYTPVKVFLGHCRKGTTGHKEDNNNNHPIKIKNIVGVHNGIIKNDDLIEKHLGCNRDGKVDSEMIFRLFDHYTRSGKEPFTLDMLTNIIDRLTGAFAVIAFNADNVHQIPVFRDDRPIEMVFIKKYGLLILISDDKFWTKVHFRYERAVNYGDLGLPSLVTPKPERITFNDCNAAIFNLDVQCTEDTAFDDICDYKEVSRANKRWTAKHLLTTSGTYVSGYKGGQKMAEDEEKRIKAVEDNKNKQKNSENDSNNKNESTNKSESETVETVEMRIFDNITRKYKVSHVANNKIVDQNESILLPAKTSTINESKSTIDKHHFEADDDRQDIIKSTLSIEDHTDYSSGTATNKQNEVNYTTIKAKGSEDEENYDHEIVDAENIVVDMTPEPPELIEQAEKAYNNIPLNKRGYSEICPLLEDISIKSEEMCEKVGLVVTANRIAKVQWKRGFIAGFKFYKEFIKAEAAIDKIAAREKYIAMLKSLVIILSQMFSKNRDMLKIASNNKSLLAKNVDEELTNITKEHIKERPSFNMEKLEGVFNDYEVDKIKEAAFIIGTVSDKSKDK